MLFLRHSVVKCLKSPLKVLSSYEEAGDGWLLGEVISAVDGSDLFDQ